MKVQGIFISLLMGIAIQNVSADQSRLSLIHEGTARSYQLYIPASYQRGKPMPLLIVLHGRSGSGLRMSKLTSFNSRAEQFGFIVVYPEGIGKGWNYLHGIAGFKEQPNDSEFLLKITDEIKSEYGIDAERIYVAGISNGGFMAQRLACYAPDKIAAFASVAAGGYAAMPVDCKNSTPVNILYMHGTADSKVPWNGLGIEDANGNQQRVTMSIVNSVKFWASRNQCSPNVNAREIPSQGNSPGTYVKVFSSKKCIENVEVVLYAIIGGGHNWPGVPDIISTSVAGRVNMDIHASDVIWSFFSGKSINRVKLLNILN